MVIGLHGFLILVKLNYIQDSFVGCLKSREVCFKILSTFKNKGGASRHLYFFVFKRVIFYSY